MGVVSMLQQQAQSLQAELNAVRGEVMRYRACHEVATMQTTNNSHQPQHMSLSSQHGTLSSSSQQPPLQIYSTTMASNLGPHGDHLHNNNNIIVTAIPTTTNTHNIHHQLSPHSRGPTPPPPSTTSSPNPSKERLISWP